MRDLTSSGNASGKIGIRYGPLLLVTALAASFVIGGMFYVMQLERHTARVHGAMASASEHVIGDLSISHLWLEEILTGDVHESVDVIFEHLEHVEADLKKLRHAEVHTHSFFTHPDLNAVPALHDNAETTFYQLLDITKQRLSQRETSGVGTPIDQQYDELFNRFIFQIDEIRAGLQSSLETHLNNLEKTQQFLILLSLFIIFVVAWVVKNSLQKQRASFEKALAAKKNQHESEERYRILIEQSPFSIQLMSPDGVIIQVNRAWEKLWGMSAAEIKGSNILHDQQLIEKGVMQHIEKGFSGEAVEIPAIHYDSTGNENIHGSYGEMWLRAFIYPLKDTDGSILQMVLMHEDITERYRQASFQFGQNKILELISDPLSSLKDVLTKLVLFVERQSSKMIGSILLVDESGQYVIDGAGPSLPDAYREAIDGAPVGPKAGSCGTAAFIGQRVIVSDIASDPLWEDYKELALSYNLHACWSQPIKDSAGKVLGTFAMYYKEIREPHDYDINLIENASQLAGNAIVHKYSMDKVILSEASMSEAQRLSHVGSWELDLVRNKLTWADETHRIFEIDADTFDASYESFLEVVHPEDREMVDKAYTHSLETKQPYEVTYRLLMKDGRIKHVNERCVSFFSDGQGVPLRSLGTVQDISELVEAQHEKEDVRAKMEHVQRLESLGVMAGGIAHDFNNILTAILGNAGLAESRLSDNSPAIEYINQITTASQKAADLCKQMLAYSGKGKFVVKPIILSELVTEMSQLLKVTIAKNIILRLDLSSQIPAVDADVTQMQQVIMNLVINASEAIGDKSGAISIATGMVAVDKQYLSTTFLDEDLQEGRYIYLEVSDTGCGMDAETKEKLFEPFYTTKFTGRGLGMAAILGIVRGHHGAIKVYSEKNKGSTFKVLFPCSKQTAVPLNTKYKDIVTWYGEGCILIVDDEETVREVATSMLEDMGFETLKAVDGVEGVEMFKKHHEQIDLVLLDMTMPKMSGEDAFTEMCRIDPDVQVILTSGYNEQDATNRFTGKDLAGFIQKPYTLEELVEKLKDIFNKT